MRLATASTATAISVLGPAAYAFHHPTRTYPMMKNSANSETSSSTALTARWVSVPAVWRRRRMSSPFFLPDVDQLFEEMDEMMETSLTDVMLQSFPRSSSLSRAGMMMNMLDSSSVDQSLRRRRRRSSDVEIHQDEKEYKLTIKMPNVDAKDLSLDLEHDGSVLRLKGHTKSEQGGMTVQSRFERSIMLDPKVDPTQISATVSSSDGVLTIVAPKLEKATEALMDKKPGLEKIEIRNAVVDDDEEEEATTHDVGNGAAEDETAPSTTRLAVEMLKKDNTVELDIQAEPPEKKWPTRDFPY